ncbi:MAG: flagellar biosynthetic protein FliO [Puniceicoccales bacterium]|jgi:flagellar biogenesis protein FliO|nr:flagellar biosynthetic protein FliO [Puniceicoccales bacterium]
MQNVMCSPVILILGETLATSSQISIAAMLIRTAIFLSLLALGGYFFVQLHRRGYFCNCKSTPNTSRDDIKVIAIRILSGKKYLTVIEHYGKRFLLALTNDKIEKLAEWDLEISQQSMSASNSQHV